MAIRLFQKCQNNKQINLPIVLGSALLWSWGFLCYLSPIMIVSANATTGNFGIEIGYFAASISSTVFALSILCISHFRSIIVHRSAFFVAAMAATASALVIHFVPSNAFSIAIIVCGLIDGISITLLGVAWGTRYSLESYRIRPLVLLSFLVAYILYFAVLLLPYPFGIICVILFPIGSWMLWKSDASSRHKITSEVFPIRSTAARVPFMGEILTGSWETSILPWRSLSVIIAAAFAGNLILSVISGKSYSEADAFSSGGVAVCACITIAALVILFFKGAAFSPKSVYGITVTLSVIGLIMIMTFGYTGFKIGGALVQGSAMFLQALTILIVTQSVQERGTSPLLAFGVGQGVVAGVIFLGNVLGKIAFFSFGSNQFLFDIICGIDLLILFSLLTFQASSDAFSSPSVPDNENISGTSIFSHSKSQDEQEPSEDTNNYVNVFATAYALTQRETDVFSYLIRGRSLPYIANELFVTSGTIKTHTMHIYKKLGVNSKEMLIDLFDRWCSENK